MKALCIGQSKLDVTVNIDKKPAENEAYDISNVIECGGGSAATTAYMLGKYGIDSYIGSVLGDDSFGTIIKKELEGVGVHTEYMESAYGKRSVISYIMNDSIDNKKNIYNICKEPLLMKKTEFQIEPDLVFVDRYDYGAALAALNRYSKTITIIDADSYTAETVELCKYCQYIVASQKFAEAFTKLKFDLTNSQSLVDIYSRIINKFPGKVVIITIGEQGALYMVDNQIRVMPSLNLEKRDTTYSEMIFNGAFAYALLQKYDLEKAVTFANIASGLSVLKVGCHNSVPEISEIMTYFNQKYPAGQ